MLLFKLVDQVICQIGFAQERGGRIEGQVSVIVAQGFAGNTDGHGRLLGLEVSKERSQCTVIGHAICACVARDQVWGARLTR